MTQAVISRTKPFTTQSAAARMARRHIGWLIALLPLALTIYFASLIERIVAGNTLAVSYAWVPSFGVNLSFYIDGLSLVFALLISGIGTLVMIYAGGYLANHPQLGRFYLYILMFMTAMLGVVLADNIITLFVFWELTSLSSYLLIGFNHRQTNARASALQALLITGSGGLALLAGLILLGQVGGSWEMSTLLSRGDIIQAHPLYVPILLLILLGAFTKSAQFPFHIWLPNAMAAPTPVSAYLHSATMVKAGVFLLARLSPVLGGTLIWLYGVTAVGAITMLVGAYLAWQQTDLKRILAYSTVSALGTLVMLLGLNTAVAVKAAVVFLIVHSLYKGALFMAAGAVDHETGTRDISKLGGLRRLMPVTFIAVGLAALSMAGALPLFLGYIGKKLIYEATLNAPNAAVLLTGAVVLANALTVVVAGLVAYRPFFGQKGNTPKKAHEAPPSMWLGPVLLSSLGLLLVMVLEFVPDSLFKPFLVSSATAILAGELAEVKLAAWSGFNLIFALSLLTLAAGLAIYAGRSSLRRFTQQFDGAAAIGPERGYDTALNGLKSLAAAQTQVLQHGHLRFYIMTIMLFTAGLVGYPLIAKGGLSIAGNWTTVWFYEGMLAAIIIMATLAAVVSKSRLATIAALGIVGYGIAVLFVLFGAPDLAMTQLAVETLTVIILALTLYHLPKFSRFPGKLAQGRDAVVALTVGGLVTLLTLTALTVPMQSRLAPFFAENSATLAKGRNIVNVILVDFRALDTLGEITVLAVAAIGIYALLKQVKAANNDQPSDSNERK